MVLGRVHVESLALELQGVFLGAAAPQADQGVQVVGLVVLHDDVGHILGLAADAHLVGFVAAGAEDGAADGEDARQGFTLHAHGAVFHQAAEAVAKTDHVHAEIALGGLADPADGCIEARTVAARGENADVFGHGRLRKNQTVQYGGRTLP